MANLGMHLGFDRQRALTPPIPTHTWEVAKVTKNEIITIIGSPNTSTFYMELRSLTFVEHYVFFAGTLF